MVGLVSIVFGILLLLTPQARMESIALFIGIAIALYGLFSVVVAIMNRDNKKLFLGGYSLAGLFALWAGYQTDRFAGIAAASPSVWFPNFTGYMRENRILAEAVYLSLGDREEKTRNPVMAKVGSAIKEGYSILTETGTDCVLEWNKGNHFKEPDLRTAKAFAWLMNRGQG